MTIGDTFAKPKHHGLMKVFIAVVVIVIAIVMTHDSSS